MWILDKSPRHIGGMIYTQSNFIQDKKVKAQYQNQMNGRYHQDDINLFFIGVIAKEVLRQFILDRSVSVSFRNSIYAD
jgi:hypothetical protein